MLVGGSLFGYLKKGSASLAGGVGSGLVLIIVGYLSAKVFKKRKRWYFALILKSGTPSISFYCTGIACCN